MTLSVAPSVTPAGRYRDDTTNGPSAALWRHLNRSSHGTTGGVDGFELFDTFYNAGGPVVSNVGGWGGYKTFEDTGCSIAQTDAAPHALRFLTDNTDNDEVNLQGAGGTGRQVTISDTAGSQRQVIAEARWTPGQVTNTYNWFWGLAEPGCNVTDGFFTDAGALPDKDFIGFWNLEADGDAVHFGYKKAGQTLVTVVSSIIVPVAATYRKLGFIFDPTFEDSKKGRIFLDGVEQSTYITADMIDTATFPDGEGLSLYACLKNQTTTAQSASCSFWRLAQSAPIA